MTPLHHLNVNGNWKDYKLGIINKAAKSFKQYTSTSFKNQRKSCPTINKNLGGRRITKF
jgi:hypothetical protein